MSPTLSIAASVLLGAVVGAVVIAGAVSWASSAAQPRYQLAQAGGGIAWRLDTKTGDLQACRLGDASSGVNGAACWPVPARNRFGDTVSAGPPDDWVPVERAAQ